jgi:FMN reductase
VATVVGVSGTLHSPSKTGRVLDAILAAVVARTGATTSTVSVLDHGHAIVDALAAPPAPALADAYDRVLAADALVVATPVYKGSYTGLLKAFVDPIAQTALADRPVLLAAIAGDDQHSLVIDHELRPLFGFFGAAVLPRGVYARGVDLADPDVFAPKLQEQIDAAVERLAAVLPASS